MSQEDDKLNPDLSKKRKSSLKVKKADRAMDNMFRIALNNHLQLSAMADNKANMLITVCSLIITLSLTSLDDPSLRPIVLCMGLTCFVTILLAVYATMPNLPPRISGKVNPRAPGFNMIFFGHFSQIDFETFRQEIGYVINDRAVVYETLAKDLYNLGSVLSKRKYRYIRYSYISFMAGLVISMVILIYTSMSPGNI